MAEFERGTVLLVDRLTGAPAKLFVKPVEILQCDQLVDAKSFLQQLEQRRKAGFYLAGYFAYEFGYAFESKLEKRWKNTSDTPLAWFGVYESYSELDSNEEAAWLNAQAKAPYSASLNCQNFDLDKAQYDAAFLKTQQHLAKGDIYQINLTVRAEISNAGDPASLFSHLLFHQPVEYGALLHTGARHILSISPELFLRKQGRKITTKPMKGTAKRGRTAYEDQEVARWLAADEKSRAENTMILDLMRNDLSRISKAGSVRVPAHCAVETYRSIFQMTSTVTAELEDDVELPEIMEELFPCGSITGAPKLWAMEIIDNLEASERGVYTGSIGFIDPNGDFCFNVAIRTLVLDENGNGLAGTGSGVVYDSGSAPEYEECKLKLQFLSEKSGPFRLFETMAWNANDGYVLLERHIARLEDSARYFNYPFSLGDTQSLLLDAAETFEGPRRVRLSLSHQGELELEHFALPESDGKRWNIAIAGETIHSNDRFLFHKTTKRSFYDESLKHYRSSTGCDEVIFLNENGFVCEGSFTNLFVEVEGTLLTPALHHGLLPGTFRAGLLEHGLAEEADLRPEDLINADAIYVGNSVRGLIECQLIRQLQVV
ncbi:aminodeoxychorismate synthase component I [Rhodobacteraceae bacterium RKSG542]|uniref:aminodeoxychorismate synthase component I n=1 Tax=Pseudovibrio flavus TaxID=2529854 RepID=UPI0012BD7734|nr:aminodeoxychorismate synthase component I [Pseudovibrio flavus]MTI17659.1 aminodeoxychorismate synthase component I [Pseudovibrio flavus]